VRIAKFSDRGALMRAAAQRVANIANAALQARGRFLWVLSGGKTPEQLFQQIAAEYATRVAWPRVHFFWGDERCVPPDDAESNYGMARHALLDALRPSPEQVHRMPGELEPALGARRYEEELRAFFAPHGSGASEFPRFDLILLGMGPDGHTASLFPGTSALQERQRWVVENHVEGKGSRLTLTFPVLNAAERVIFIVAGADKAARLRDILEHPMAEDLPAQRVRPCAGAEWLIDEAAAGLLPERLLHSASTQSSDEELLP
jgi:6-phosphogluconolactonase